MSDSLNGKRKNIPEPADEDASGDVEDSLQEEQNEARQEEKEEEKYDLSDDDDVMSKADYKEYCRQVKESDGFDVDSYFSKYTTCGVIMPLPRDEVVLNYHTPFAEIAIHQYNKDNSTKFKVVRLEQVNLQEVCRHSVFYITFHATENAAAADAPTSIFQTKMIEDYAGYLSDSGMPEITLELCRLKSIPNEGNAEVSCSAKPADPSSTVGAPDLTYPTDSPRIARILA